MTYDCQSTYTYLCSIVILDFCKTTDEKTTDKDEPSRTEIRCPFIESIKTGLVGYNRRISFAIRGQFELA